eukprot:PITA_12319
MANERIGDLESTLKDVLLQLKNLNETLSKGKMEECAEAYIGNENIEGESSQSLHLFGTHQQSQPQPPKLDMYKFDGSHPATWIAQMEQYFTLNHIMDDATQLSVGSISSEEAPPLKELEEEEEDNQHDNVPEEPVISLHALVGISSPKTLKIRGFIKHRPMVVLIDSGSTHNFIHQRVTEAVHCFVQEVSNFQVQIVDGGTMKCEGRCENVKLQMGDYQLKTHMFAIHMGGCDIVLVFDKPHELPPSRGEHDHSITLVPGAQPPNVRPYRYPFTQKNEIEKIIKKLLEAGVIRPSISPYSSRVVMVLKKDGEWRMCLDFRALNKLAVKDKFPIPVVDDLLDELNGAQFFTKLDLRSGYHQIRMKEVDIPKTAFQTHEGHYEFLVMPFGLYNAPSTFQCLMNHLLKPYLRKFVLVFFDDILIYSRTRATHLQHVDLLLQLLRKHKLFVKMSKCYFGMEEVDYLGHIVGREGVRVDPKKIQAIQDWPQPKTLKSLRGFLGLIGYYHKFICNYGRIARPLTQLLKKNSFLWNDEAQ